MSPAIGSARRLQSPVEDEHRDVMRGEVCTADDSINHEAWNNGADDRIVLIFDVWHPDLTEQERRDITSLLSRCLPSGK